jgi:hypothetical protein
LSQQTMSTLRSIRCSLRQRKLVVEHGFAFANPA